MMRPEENETTNFSEAQSASPDVVGIQNENGSSERKATPLQEAETETNSSNRYLNAEEKKSPTETAIAIYQEIERLLESDKCNNGLTTELELSFPEYRSTFIKWRRDLEKTDHGIVIAGETSSGKSTLINKILGIKLFQGKVLESTSTICKIRNSNQIRMFTTDETGHTELKYFSNKGRLQYKEGIKEIREYLKKRTSVSPDDSVDIQIVDIRLPAPFLKQGNTILVDTPGIGGSGKVTQKLIEYLPNALAFIFVIDVSSAGGMQKDRLPRLLQTVTDLQKQSEMPCFNPENVVFITNKWDLVQKQIESSDEDGSENEREEEIGIWENLKKDIKQMWPLVKEENIFQMNLKDVSSQRRNYSTRSFENFKKILASLVKKAEGLRVIEHLRFLQNILKAILKGINITINNVEKSKEKQDKKNERIKKDIELLRNECTEVEKKYKTMVEEDIDAIVKECETYMSTDEGKNKILNPAGRVPINKINWNKADFEAKIKSRIDLYVKDFLKSDAVLNRYKNIGNKIQTFHDKIITKIKDLEGEPENINPLNEKDTESKTYLIQIGLISSPAWLTALAFGVNIPAAFFGGFLFFMWSFFGWVSKSIKEIDDEYKKCKSKVSTAIRNDLEKRFASPIQEMVRKVTDDLLLKIDKLEENNKTVQKEVEQIVANCNLLSQFDLEIRALEATVTSLQKEIGNLKS